MNWNVPSLCSKYRDHVMYNGSTLLASNTNSQSWGNSAFVARIDNSVWYEPGSTSEPIIAGPLPPGTFTVKLSGVNGATGIGLLGIYEFLN